MKTAKKMYRWLGGVVLSATLFSLTASAQDSPHLTDPEIASVAVTANKIDVGYGGIALKKSKNAEIKKFAQTMVHDHDMIIKQAVALAGKLGVTPKDNALTQQLLSGAKKETATLNGKKGKAFDKAYIDNEVAYHEAVIGAVKNVLIPQTQNAELKALLVKVSPLLQAHLEMAKKMQADFK